MSSPWKTPIRNRCFWHLWALWGSLLGLLLGRLGGLLARWGGLARLFGRLWAPLGGAGGVARDPQGSRSCPRRAFRPPGASGIKHGTAGAQYLLARR
eukprot:6565806-Pyramimonas_sp.AAC.1